MVTEGFCPPVPVISPFNLAEFAFTIVAPMPLVTVGGSMGRGLEQLINATKASLNPALAACNGFWLGKLSDSVYPVRYALLESSMAIPLA
jgi:hypothetical protein